MLRRNLFCLTLVAAALIGCSADSATATSPSVSFVGNWKVSSVNGSPLPYIVRTYGPGESITLQSGSFAIGSDSRWTYHLSYLVASSGSTSTVDDNGGGQWSQSNGALNLYNPVNGEIINGTMSKGVLTLYATLEGITDNFALGLTH